MSKLLLSFVSLLVWVLAAISPAIDISLPWAFQGSSFAPAGSPEDVRFREAAVELGIDFHHFNGATGEYFLPEIMGAGIALFDYDGDGDLDVYLVQGTLLDGAQQLEDALFPPRSRPPRNRLFRNNLVESGGLRFTDVTEAAGVGHEGFGMGAAVGDYDNDGHLDLYVTNVGPNVLYRNNGDGTFRDVTRRTGVEDDRWNASAGFIDYDLDGDLDLFVTAYVDFTVSVLKKCYDKTGARDYCSPTIYDPLPDRLFRNEGNGTFIAVSDETGITASVGNGLGVAVADFNSDGWPDLYVANDQTPNELWINSGDGTFEAMGLVSGTAYNASGVAEAGMGVAVADVNQDGHEDIFVTNLTRETNTLYLNDGQGNFQDSTLAYRLAGPSLPFTGFGTDWFDLDNDGDLDLFVANGAVTLEESRIGEPYPFQQRNQLFRNDGKSRFKEISAPAGPGLELLEVSRGVTVGDLDNNGHLDIVVSNNNGPVRIFLSETKTRSRWLQVSLRTAEKNRYGIGAQVALGYADGTQTRRRVETAGSYLSASPSQVHFGIEESRDVQDLVVQWPDGYREYWPDPTLNTHLTLRRDSGQRAPDRARP